MKRVCLNKNVVYFLVGLCVNEMPELKGGFSACLGAGTIPGEPRSPMLGLMGWMTFRHWLVASILCGQYTCVGEKKGFFAVFCVLVTDGTEKELFVVVLPSV